MVVDIAPNLVPDVGHELPFVDESRMLAHQKEGRIELTDGACRAVTVQAHCAACRAKGGLGLATPARALDEDRAGRTEAIRQFGVNESWPIVDDPASDDGLVGVPTSGMVL